MQYEEAYYQSIISVYCYDKICTYYSNNNIEMLVIVMIMMIITNICTIIITITIMKTIKNYYDYKLTLPVLILLQSAPFSTRHFTISKGPSLADQWSGVHWYYDLMIIWYNNNNNNNNNSDVNDNKENYNDNDNIKLTSSLQLTLDPFASNTFAASNCLPEAAEWRGVKPIY